MVKVTIQWNKKNIETEINQATGTTGLDFKKQLQQLTGVPADRQKVMGIPGVPLLKDDTLLEKLKIKDGMTVKLLGTAETLPEPKEKMVFAEDLVDDEEDALMVRMTLCKRKTINVNLSLACTFSSFVGKLSSWSCEFGKHLLREFCDSMPETSA